jgi:hypothetical protein
MKRLETREKPFSLANKNKQPAGKAPKALFTTNLHLFAL